MIMLFVYELGVLCPCNKRLLVGVQIRAHPDFGNSHISVTTMNPNSRRMCMCAYMCTCICIYVYIVHIYIHIHLYVDMYM